MSDGLEGRFASWMQARIDRITAACTYCGKCYEVCPMVPYGEARGAGPEQVTRAVVDILNDRPHARAGAVWAETCQKSGVCIEACPEDVNPREMLSYAKLKLKWKAEDAEHIAKNGRDYFKSLSRAIRLMMAFQAEPDLFKELTSVRSGKKKNMDAVFYFGCNILQTPHILLSCIDVFDRMGLSYEVAGGMAHCCGINHIRRGDLTAGAAMGAKSLQHFRAHEPEMVITFCPTCQMQYTEYIHLYEAPEVEKLPFVHITQYLAGNLDKLRALCTHPVRKRIALHEHTGTDGVAENIRKVLGAVPGLELVEVAQRADHGYQCPTLLIPEAKAAMREKLFSSAESAGVDALVTIYHSCHRELCGEEKRHSFRVVNFMSILGEAMGFSYPDQTQAFKLYEDIDRVIAEAEDLLRENGVDPGKMRDELERVLYAR
ncbi:MAG: (Fe-S)-binding protein [bacterium]|nr:(Fe-S)-binding protein [bacterium]